VEGRRCEKVKKATKMIRGGGEEMAREREALEIKKLDRRDKDKTLRERVGEEHP
jgi:hypothetical protein